MNKKLMTPLFLAASFMLVGCSSDTIVARPPWQNDNIIEDTDGLKDNKMKAIYDAIKALGDTNANVLTKVMYKIALNQIGSFGELSDIATTKEEDVTKLIQSTEFKNFVKAHPVYKAETIGATRKAADADTTQVALNETQQALTSFDKIKLQYNQIIEDVYEKLYDEIKGGSYSTSKTKLFQEQYFIDHLIKELYDVKIPDGFAAITNKVFMPRTKGEPWKQYVNNKFLQVTDATTGKLTGVYNNYIERKILPELYKTYLVQTYVAEQRYSSLGRSYARKVNMVSITVDDNNRFNVPKMLKYYVKNYMQENNLDNHNLEYITKAMIGFVGNNETTQEDLNIIKSLLIGENGTEKAPKNFDLLSIVPYGKSATTDYYYLPKTLPNGSDIVETDPATVAEGLKTRVYKGTKLGELLKKIEKCCDITIEKGADNEWRITGFTPKQFMTDAQKTAYNELTGNGAYNIEKGIKIKEREIRQTDYTKDGWFLKNGGLTDISSEIRDRLFNITTSTQVDEYNRKAIGGPDYELEKDYIKYLGNKSSVENRKAFLTMPSTTGTLEDRLVLNESGNNNYYIIEVEEAANTSKLAKGNNAESYARIKSYTNDVSKAHESTLEYNKLAKEIVKANSSSDTYKKNANEYYLMISNIVFYDQSVYDYFKSQFPELFK